ncbi:MAG: PQQ-binding-like beta-propeller repeat protein, partial [Planctomycetota bacterium]|nr:PQQ-binding-like beta-propeller repeat protein [Planctomycetota bacterium]
PVEFSFENKVQWQATLGDGVSCPIVSQGRVFATGMADAKKFAIMAFDAADGSAIWRREFDAGKLPRITPPNSHASSTPATDGKRVYAYLSTLGMIAVDAASGKHLWTAPIQQPAYLMDWGAASSPIVHDGLVIFCQDDDLAPMLYAIDAETGKLRWKTERPDMLGGYAVPVICEANGQVDIVVSGTGKLKGYNPKDGTERWTCNSLIRTMMTSPVVRDGIIYISCQSYGDEKRTLKFALLEWLDTNQDGVLTKEEVPPEFRKRFDVSDRDHDGVLKDAELDTAFQSPENMVGGGTTIQAVRGGGQGDVTKTHLLWNLKNTSPSNMVSPLVVGNQLFVVKRGGISSSFDIRTGDTFWKMSRIGNLGDYYSSPVAGDGKIYVTGENGFITVLAQGEKLEVLAKNDMGEPCVATPAIADGRIYIRTREKIFCVAEH